MLRFKLPHHSFFTEKRRLIHMLGNKRNAIGILGGVFDPIHRGHIETARSIKELLKLKELHLLPTYKPPHKTPSASAYHRMKMVELVAKYEPSMRVNYCEYQRESVSITIDTIEALRQENPNSPICFIVGMDSLETLTTWDRWKDIIKSVHLVVTSRPHYAMPTSGEVIEFLKPHITTDLWQPHDSLAGKVMFLKPNSQFNISSTLIRKKLLAGADISDLVTKEVYDYIRRNQLYGVKNYLLDSVRLPSINK